MQTPMPISKSMPIYMYGKVNTTVNDNINNNIKRNINVCFNVRVNVNIKAHMKVYANDNAQVKGAYMFIVLYY